MEAGQLIGGRYIVEKIAGAGGMGRVYRARDNEHQGLVALKVLNLDAKKYSRRFNREAQLLKELEHPKVVRFIDNGITKAGEPFIVMEWVDGEDVRQRMNRKPLTPFETMTIVRQIAQALGAAHQIGIIHRDLKPSNLMLIDNNHENAKLLDFGIARWRGPLVDKMTKTGISIGTPGYMAPEQARGEKDIDGRADIYALGCVIYEVLTGRRPFAGDSKKQTQSKPLIPPRISTTRNDISAGFDELIASMIAEDPSDRPKNGEALVSLIDDIGARSNPNHSVHTPRITGGERKLLSMVLVGASGDNRVATVTMDGPEDPGTEAYKRPKKPSETSIGQELEKFIHTYGGQISLGHQGSIRGIFESTGSATDLVTQAAKCALAIRHFRPLLPMVLVTGRGELSSHSKRVEGEVVFQANALLKRHSKNTRDKNAALPTEHSQIHIDEVTAGLLNSRFEVGAHGSELVLKSERLDPVSRQLLGKQTQCVGREPEFMYLDRLFQSVIEKQTPRAVLLTAEAGVGKTRIQTEWVKRLKAKHSDLNVLVGRGDPVARGEAFHMMSRLIRETAGIIQQEPLPIRQKKLRARIGRNLSGEKALLVTEFLGEMSGSPFPAHEERLKLRSARSDATLMGDQIRFAWETFIAAECKSRPTLIVLEDLHWGDSPSIRLIDGILRNIQEGMWSLLAVARPEVHEVFPNLWKKHSVDTMRLTELSDTAAAQMIKQSLGDHLDGSSIKRLVKLSGGNAYYLEELIRAVSENRVQEVPGTILAMAQSRLDLLPASLRRVLRAGSVFGRIFWQRGVESLVGTDDQSLDLGAQLEELEDLEFISSKDSTVFPDEKEFSFHHELIRESAYSTLTERDKSIGHKLAGEWLEKNGSHDSLTLATHFELGASPERATSWYAKSAEQALEGDDLDAVLKRIHKGIACGAEGETLGLLRSLEARTQLWRGEYAVAEERSATAMDNQPVGSAEWYHSAGLRISAAGTLGDHQKVIAIANFIIDVSDGQVARGPQVTALAKAAGRCLFMGRYDEGVLLLGHLPEDLTYFAEKEPGVVGFILTAKGYLSHQDGDLASYLEHFEESTYFFQEAGDRRSAVVAQVNIGFAYLQLGNYSAAEAILQKVLDVSERMALGTTSSLARNNLGCVLTGLGRLDEAWDHELMAIESFALQGNVALANNSRVYLSKILQLKGNLNAAEREVRDALAKTTELPMFHAQALTQLGSLLLEKELLPEAIKTLEKAKELRDSMGQVLEVESEMLVLLHDVYEKSGRPEDAYKSAQTAYESLMSRTAKIRDPGWRACFTRNKAENRRILDLANQYGLTAVQT